MGLRRVRALRALALCALAQLCWGYDKTVEVSTCGQLLAALNDTSVDRVLLLPVPGGWSCGEAQFPRWAVRVRHRNLTMEGKGPGLVYFNGNRITYQVAIGQGATVFHRNLWADNCLAPAFPYACFSGPDPSEGGAYTSTEDGEMSDATCINVRHSQGIAGLAVVLPFAKLLRFRADYEYLDDRRLLIRHTDWMPASNGNYFRFINTTLSCTGNVTFPLPPDFQDARVVRELPVSFGLIAAGGAGLLAMAAALWWGARRTARNSQLPEYKVAASQGYRLKGALGSGHFGRVYLARSAATGQPVAIKVVDMLPTQRRQVAAAWRECQLMSRIQHDCVVQVISFYTAQVQQRQHVMEATSVDGGQYIDMSYDVLPAVLGSGDSQGASALGSLGSGSSAALSDGTDASAPGVRSIQMHLVMQYCDMGTLEQAIKDGYFWDEDTGEPLLRHIVLTALEVARGLEHIHHPDRRMVHRDLSAANVLLASSAGDERGFRALLSDFGLSTSLAQEATHRTSEVKGTISYMSPEVFLHDDVSPALDVYSLGITLHMMVSGLDPYADQTPAMAILSKVRAAERGDDSRLPSIPDCPEALQQLVWDCTHHSRRSRPSAAEVVRRLEALLASL